MATENPSFIDDFPIETSIYMGFPTAMFDYQRVQTLDFMRFCQISVDFVERKIRSLLEVYEIEAGC